MYSVKSSKSVTALREVVLDKKWLNNLGFYVQFRLVISVVGSGFINLKTVNFLALVKMFPPPPSSSNPPLQMNLTHSIHKVSTLLLEIGCFYINAFF